MSLGGSPATPWGKVRGEKKMEASQWNHGKSLWVILVGGQV